MIDWAWPSMSNLTSFQNYVYLHRFCVFKIFVRRAKTEFVELFHIAHGAAHILFPIYARQTGSCHGPWNSLVTNLCETIGVLPAFHSAIGRGFYKLVSDFVKLYAPHIPIFYITTSAITETTVKQPSFAFICSGLTLSDEPYFSAVVSTRFT